MPVPTSLAVEFTPAEITAMQDAAKLINDTIKAKVDMNLSEDERKTLSKVGPEREPYVSQSINTYADQYAHLNGLAVPVSNAKMDATVYGQMQNLLSLMSQATERAVELQMVAGHFAYRFMRDQYNNAKQYKDSASVEGAQVVYDGLKDCFERDTLANDTPPSV